LRIIEVHPNGLVITIRRSKTNQRGDDEELPPGPRWPIGAPSPRCRPGSNRPRSLICLPFKAKAVREKDRADFEAVLPRDVFRAAGLASHGARTGASRSRLDFRYGMSRG
jgi:hypothetical protein